MSLGGAGVSPSFVGTGELSIGCVNTPVPAHSGPGHLTVVAAVGYGGLAEVVAPGAEGTLPPGQCSPPGQVAAGGGVPALSEGLGPGFWTRHVC